MRKKEAKKCWKAFIYKENRHFFIRENKEKDGTKNWKMREKNGNDTRGKRWGKAQVDSE